jgi:hypothetical protein
MADVSAIGGAGSTDESADGGETAGLGAPTIRGVGVVGDAEPRPPASSCVSLS